MPIDTTHCRSCAHAHFLAHYVGKGTTAAAIISRCRCNTRTRYLILLYRALVPSKARSSTRARSRSYGFNGYFFVDSIQKGIKPCVSLKISPLFIQFDTDLFSITICYKVQTWISILWNSHRIYMPWLQYHWTESPPKSFLRHSKWPTFLGWRRLGCLLASAILDLVGYLIAN